MRLLLAAAALALLAGLLLAACGQTGYITGSAVEYCDSFTREEVDLIELAAAQSVCKKIQKRLGDRPCTPNLVNEIMQELRMYWHGTGIDYCADFLPPDEE